MMSEDLVKYKEESINKHFQDFVDVINNMNKRIDNALRDKQLKLQIGGEYLSTLKVSCSFDNSSTLGMTSSDKVQYAKMWFESKQNDINTLKEISTEPQRDFLKTLDEEIAIARNIMDTMQKKTKR